MTGFDVPYPYWQLEDWYMPSVERVSTRCVACSRSERLTRYDVSAAWAIRACSKPARRQSRRTSVARPGRLDEVEARLVVGQERRAEVADPHAVACELDGRGAARAPLAAASPRGGLGDVELDEVARHDVRRRAGTRPPSVPPAS